ncbi:Oidioi.mRNA.OKI2018_I69.XSR.g16875.t1.cds [Oikopleura dioica]|uniref:Oidioi.mRNA.OKI2018_I69.XSR.g16875.t1.cds n=1 Tax=Oikopleura dioica TaxID=34765 RepID=A0ABN7SLP6_OIKDI|nr:Oidioi.mRNA.OKI2018_I69.XSR.g16875.t1.cds [Oikopleura dioica]
MLRFLRECLCPTREDGVEMQENQPARPAREPEERGNNNANLEAEIDSLRWELDQSKNKIASLQKALNEKTLAEEENEAKIQLLKGEVEKLKFQKEMLEDRLK